MQGFMGDSRAGSAQDRADASVSLHLMDDDVADLRDLIDETRRADRELLAEAADGYANEGAASRALRRLMLCAKLEAGLAAALIAPVPL